MRRSSGSRELQLLHEERREVERLEEELAALTLVVATKQQVAEQLTEHVACLSADKHALECRCFPQAACFDLAMGKTLYGGESSWSSSELSAQSCSDGVRAELGYD